MENIERRAFMQGAGLGALAFTVGGAKVLLTPQQARAQGVAFRTLTPEQVDILEALGETIVPGAEKAGIANYVDQQISIPPEEALLEARIAFNMRPPYANFYRAALAAVDSACERVTGYKFATAPGSDQYTLVDNMRQNKVEGWQGPPTSALVYAVMRADAVDVVYGTMEGAAALDIPYMAHIAPTKRW